MNLSEILADFTPGAAGIWATFSMLAVYFIREWRETRKLSLEDRMARREGYAKQVESLTIENRALRSEIAMDRQKHDEYRQLCRDETDQLRKHIIRLEDIVQGFKRKVDEQALQIIRFRAGETQ